MKPVIHQNELYNSETGADAEAALAIFRLRQIEELIKQSGDRPPRKSSELGRNLLTRAVDTGIRAVRRFAPPLHWLGAAIFAGVLFIYAWLLALTVRLTTTGERQWPDLPAPCVLAMWHGCVNSWVVAMTAKQPRAPLAIMIARDPRGDSLALLCRWLGMRAVRGESGERGWEALAELARKMSRGASAVITADGTGPALVAKVGAVALASATGAPLIPTGAACRPAIHARRKWDQVRTPLPFGRVAVALGHSHQYPIFADLLSIEQARCRLEDSLNEVASAARSKAGTQSGI
jgi:lysophospholipid acyltransferase (LPLAT)-like uncharacterized protein